MIASATASSSELAARRGALGLASLDPALADVARRRVFDTLGALAAGRGVTATTLLGELRGVIGDGLPARVGELVATVRCSEIDDIDRGSCTTPGSVAVPVALAVGAARGAPAGDVLAGVVAGYEAMVRLGEAIDGAHAMYRGIWPSYLAAPFAAAATAARVLGLDAQRTAHALAIAATRTVGFAGRIDAEETSRWMTYGCAAADGVLAALAAQAGMVGDPRALDVALPAAIAVALAGERFADGADAVGGGWRIAGVDVKPWCTARQTQAAVEAAVRAAAELNGRSLDAGGALDPGAGALDPGGGALDPAALDPAAVEIGVPEAYRAMIDQPAVGGRLTSMLSAQFQIAAALTRPELLCDVRRRDLELPPAGRAIAREARVVAVDELTARFPAAWPARVRLRTRAGREAVVEVDHPAGSAQRPFDWEALRAKHARIGAWDEARGRRVLAACRSLGAGGAPVGVPAALLDEIEMSRTP